MEILFEFLKTTGFASMTVGNAVMIVIGMAFITLAITKDYEPLLLVPIGMGAIVGNIPVIEEMSLSVYDQHRWLIEGGEIRYVPGSVLSYLYFGVSYGIYPPLIFLGIGAMTDFSTMLSNPKLVLLGAAAQVGVFLTFLGALWLGFEEEEAGAIGIIGGADGPTTDENIFIAAACKEKGIRFLKGEAEIGVRKIEKESAEPAAPPSAAKPGEPAEFVVTVNGEDIFMAFEGNMVTVDGKVYHVGIKPQAGGEAAVPSSRGAGELTEVKAQMPGAVYKQLVHAGDHVRAGEAILILEAMKMEMEVASPVDGTIDEIRFAVGDQVHTGQVLATVKK